jgi:type I restriction enzyme M protein
MSEARSSVHEISGRIERISDILRGDFRQTEYSRIILPLVVLRRLDYVSGRSFESLRGKKSADILAHIRTFSDTAREILIERFLLPEWLKKLEDSKSLSPMIDLFCGVDLSLEAVSGVEMGYLFEDLIRRFSELSNETAGEHYTPPEATSLIVDILLSIAPGSDGKRTFYDPTCGTGGMLSAAEARLREIAPGIEAELYGQELNPDSYAIAKADALIKGADADRIAVGNTLTADAFPDMKFDYMLSNPPYGVDWKKYKDEIEAEAKRPDGRFGAGLPRVSDGQFLFIQHLVSKMKDSGSRVGVVTSGSPLFAGGAGSGESEIRRWLIERDLIEAIIQLPTDIFYNTGIQTYVWIITNRKAPERREKIQLIDASTEEFWKPMKKALGSKRRQIPDEARAEIVRIYRDFVAGDSCKVMDAADFGYREIRVERPLRLAFEATAEAIANLRQDKAFEKMDARAQEAVLAAFPSGRVMDAAAFDDALRGAGVKLTGALKKAIVGAIGMRDPAAEIVRDGDGKAMPDTELRDTELVPLSEDVSAYVEREVSPFVPDAWVDDGYRDDKDSGIGRVGYEINFNRYFYKEKAGRSLEDIRADLKATEIEILKHLKALLT